MIKQYKLIYNTYSFNISSHVQTKLYFPLKCAPSFSPRVLELKSYKSSTYLNKMTLFFLFWRIMLAGDEEINKFKACPWQKHVDSICRFYSANWQVLCLIKCSECTQMIGIPDGACPTRSLKKLFPSVSVSNCSKYFL